MQVTGHRVLVDALGVDAAGGRVARDLAGGLGDLGAPAVVHAVIDRDHPVVHGHVLGDVEFLDDASPHPGPRSDPAHPDSHGVEVLPAPAHDLPVEAHQEPDFLGTASPVLGRERVDGQVLDAQFDRAAGDVDEDRLAHLVPLGAAQAALGCPPAVAVHHDRDVLGQLVGRDRRWHRFGDVLGWPARAAAGGGRQLREHHGPAGGVGENRIVVGRGRQLREPLPPALSPPPGAGHPVDHGAHPA